MSKGKKNPEGVAFKKNQDARTCDYSGDIDKTWEWDAEIDGYDVVYKGKTIGNIELNSDIPSGYWGRWSASIRMRGDSRRDVAEQLVKQYLAKEAA